MSKPSEEINTPTRIKFSSKWNFLKFIIMFMLLIILSISLACAYLQLMKHQINLTKIIISLEQQFVIQQKTMIALSQALNDLSTITEKSQNLITKQEKILNDWDAAQKGNLDKWYLAEAQHLIKLASNHALLINNEATVMTLLQQASQALQNVQNVRAIDIRKSLETEIAQLNAQPAINIDELYLQLMAIDKQLNQLPIATNLLQPTTSPLQQDLNLS